jgi:hypothetical protein
MRFFSVFMVAPWQAAGASEKTDDERNPLKKMRFTPQVDI